ncbi:Siroheme synthase [Roseovarius sp. THAF27]|uniref:NAD(P)-dependent oxidoreductase n=1 Tax=unclassified Roseovarius TaxID=2614913 RepID=UPI0012A91F10|nr:MULTISPECIES: NAD(P)-dependent oxidoreductase [unclassified Roseovarius]QFT78977.1 Siroheme synthase [Roseovarius sp. THAF27]QFT97869.1 Siroheme synthase [Roseovarius sp. THAF8]
MKAFPMFIRTTGRRIVVVGGGEQAAQKARLMLKTDASLVLVADSLEDCCPRIGRVLQDAARGLGATESPTEPACRVPVRMRHSISGKCLVRHGGRAFTD